MKNKYLTLIFCCLFVVRTGTELINKWTSTTKTEEDDISLKFTLDGLQEHIVTNLERDVTHNDSMTPSTTHATNASNIESEKKQTISQTTISTNSTTSEEAFTLKFYSGRKSDNSSNEHDFLLSNISKLLKQIIPKGYMFGSTKPDVFGFEREYTTKKAEYKSQQKGKRHKLIHRQREGNPEIMEDLNGKTFESIINGTGRDYCDNCSNIFIFIDRNDSSVDSFKHIMTEAKSIKGAKIAIIAESILHPWIKPKGSTKTNKVDETFHSDSVPCFTINNSGDNSVTVMKHFPEDYRTVPTNSIAMPTADDYPPDTNPSTRSTTNSDVDLDGKFLKSIDVDLKLKQELTVTGSLKLNYS